MVIWDVVLALLWSKKKRGKNTLSTSPEKEKHFFFIFMMWLLHRKKKNAPPITADSTKDSWPSRTPIPVLVIGTFLPAGEGPLAATSVASDLTNLWIMKFWAYKYRCRSAYVATKWISSKRSCSSSWNPISLTRVKCVPSPLSPLVCTIPICIYNSISVHFSKNKIVHNSSSEGYWQDTTKVKEWYLRVGPVLGLWPCISNLQTNLSPYITHATNGFAHESARWKRTISEIHVFECLW